MITVDCTTPATTAQITESLRGGVIYAVGGHVYYDKAGLPPKGFVLCSDGIWRLPKDKKP